MQKLLAPIVATALLFTAAPPGHAQEKSSIADGASLYFIAPQNGDTVQSPITIRFGLSGAGVAPAGTKIDNTGHHHLIIDAPLPPLDQPVPADDNHRHFGKGQTETTVELAPGEHTLQLLLGDWLHIPHEQPLTSEQITITVE